MEQEPTPITDLLELIVFLGSIVFILGATYQIYILIRNKKTWASGFIVLVLTRVLTITFSLIIWHLWNFPFDIMFLFLFLPALLPELILSPLILKVFGNDLCIRKPVHNNI